MKKYIFSALIGVLFFTAQNVIAAEIYVLDTINENTGQRWSIATKSLVQDAVSASGKHTLTETEAAADYVLQPKLLGLGGNYILTIEKHSGNQVILANQIRLTSLDKLDKAAARATREVLDGRPTVLSGTTVTSDELSPENPLETSSRTESWDRGATPIYNYWTAGIGPFGGNNLDTDNILYGMALGHTWDIHPQASIKALGEAALSTGEEDANFFNFAVGPSYYFMGGNNARSPYASLDFGYGFGQANNNEDINGFSLGIGGGYRFFRTATTGMEINIRWATIFDPVVGDDNPQIIGARLGVDF